MAKANNKYLTITCVDDMEQVFSHSFLLFYFFFFKYSFVLDNFWFRRVTFNAIVWDYTSSFFCCCAFFLKKSVSKKPVTEQVTMLINSGGRSIFTRETTKCKTRVKYFWYVDISLFLLLLTQITFHYIDNIRFSQENRI